MNDYSFSNDRTRPSQAQPIGSSTLGSREIQQSQFAPGEVIEGRYQIMSVIGHGGFGCVYKVHQMMLNKQFALKTLNPVHATDVTIMRLQKEGHAASRLEHRNLVRAVDFGMINGVQPFLVMELIDGPTLSDYLKERGKISLEAALEIFIPIAQALAYAHGQGIVHRDLKPSNVMLAASESGFGPFVPKIVDFGIAKIQFADDGHAMTLTSTGDVFGTPLYMSPEQCAGTAIDARTDIYSLGCMLFEALTGGPPFRGRNALEIMMQHGTATVPSLKEASMGGNFPRQIERIIARTLAKSPNERYSNCQRLADDLFALQQGDLDRISTIAQTGAVLPRPVEKKQTSLLYLGLTGAVSGLVGLTIGFLASSSRPAPQTPTQTVSTIRPLKAQSMEGAMQEVILPNANDKDLYSYFSTSQDGRTEFTFPAWKSSMGMLNYWSEKGLVSVPVVNKQSVPVNSKLIFAPTSTFFRQPDLWSRFHQKELYGILTNEMIKLTTAESVNQAIRVMVQQDNLRILQIVNQDLTSKSWQGINNISHLLWLDFDDMKIDGKALKGEDMANLQCLRDLHLLRIDEVESATPFLKKLAEGCALRRLSLVKANLVDEDIKLVTKFRSLEVLSLRDWAPHGGNPVEEIAKMNHLKVLIVDPHLLATTPPETLKKLHGITIVIPPSFDGEREHHQRFEEEDDEAHEHGHDRGPSGEHRGWHHHHDGEHFHHHEHFHELPVPPEEWKKVLVNLSKCKLVEKPRRELENDWFSALKTNPADIDI